MLDVPWLKVDEIIHYLHDSTCTDSAYERAYAYRAAQEPDLCWHK